MVIGNGMIAKAFKSYESKDDFVIFASGVSDSVDPSSTAFEREKKLLTDTIHNSNGKTLVYFSTCSIYDQSMVDAHYVNHKRNMEALVTGMQSSYSIFRLSNPVGHTTNSTTLINFLVNHILERRHFNVWRNASRNIIDIDDMFTVTNEILQERLFPNAITNIANPQNYPIPFIVERIEGHFGIKADYTFISKGDSPQIDVSAIEPLFKKFNINFGENYLSQLLQKYFPGE
ncbi:MAG: NAD-dependent epimerase/dehydratase family protein [Ferruginibacter sp.]